MATNTKRKTCLKCKKEPFFNDPTEIVGKYCYDHKSDIMINVLDRKCSKEGCITIPCYNFPKEKKAMFCKEHREDGMVNVKDARCLSENCIKIATCNFPNEKKRLFCSTHKLADMIDVSHKHCAVPECYKRAGHNYITEKTPLYCNEHRLKDMVNVTTRRCLNETCIRRPAFNFPDKKTAIYCSVHKLDGMTDIKTKKCLKCDTVPNFNFPGEKRAIYCEAHALFGMMNIRAPKCTKCSKVPSFNYPSEKNAIVCLEHIEKGMINMNSKRCRMNRCRECAIYGNVNCKPQYCDAHKDTGMVNLVIEDQCSLCDNEHIFNINGIKYCSSHVPETHTNTIKRKCKYCDILEDVSFVCKDCKKIQHQKEYSIVRYLRKVIDTPFEYNTSKVLNRCSKRRPDIYFELDKHCVIVEIDEDQHRTYKGSCECARISEIVGSIGGLSVVFIRYNPDSVKHRNAMKKIDATTRINLLVKTIQDEIQRNYEKFTVRLVQLFYDDHNEIFQYKRDEDITNYVAI